MSFGHAQDVKAPIVREIRFEGLKSINPAELRAKINSRIGEPYNRHTLSDDLRRLHQTANFYSRNNQPPVRSRTEELPGGGVRITFIVTERPRYREIRFSGLLGFKKGYVGRQMKALGIVSGLSYDDYNLSRFIRRCRKNLNKRGYIYAKLEFKLKDLANDLVDLEVTVKPGIRVYIDELQFVGIDHLEDPDDLIDMADLKSKPRRFWGLSEEGYFDRENLDGDLKQINQYFRSVGFLDAKVTLDKLQFSQDQEWVTPVIRVIEGNRYSVGKVDIQGNLVYSAAQIRKRLELGPGKPFQGTLLVQDIDAMKRLYAEKAYMHAQVRFELNYDRKLHLVNILYSVIEGKKVRVERIVTQGNEKTKDKVIRRNLTQQPGQLFDGRLIEDSLGRLNRRRYFEDIQVTLRPGVLDDNDDEIDSEDLVLSFKEGRTGSFVIGGGVSTNAGFFANLTFNQRNFDITDFPTSFDDLISGRAFTGAGQDLTIQAQPGRERSQYRISWTDPYWLDTPMILGMQAFIFDRVWNQHREGRIGFIPRLGYRISPDLTLFWSHRFERVRNFDLDFDAIPDIVRVSGNNYLSGSRLELTMNRNLVDSQFVQYSGYGWSAGYEVLGGPFGGEVTLSRAEANANWQMTLFEFPRKYKWVFGLRGSVGWQEAYGRDSETPYFERYFAGGVRSFRGFEFRSISPRDEYQIDEPRGGDFQILGTVDMSFPIFKGFLRGVVFSDIGTVESTIQDYKPSRMRITAGFGFRINVAIFPAPVALDFAWPIRERRIDNEQVFSFAVGIGF